MSIKQRDYDIKPKPTTYNGIKYRSRLEARWAVFFTTLGIHFEYEKHYFELPSGFYLPDFLIPSQEKFPKALWIEVKGPSTERLIDDYLLRELIEKSKIRGTMLFDIPEIKERDIHTCSSYNETCGTTKTRTLTGNWDEQYHGIFGPRTEGVDPPYDKPLVLTGFEYPYFTDYIKFEERQKELEECGFISEDKKGCWGDDYPYVFTQCPFCESFGFEFDGRSARIGCEHSHDGKVYNDASPDLVRAYRTARRFDFEEQQ